MGLHAELEGLFQPQESRKGQSRSLGSLEVKHGKGLKGCLEGKLGRGAKTKRRSTVQSGTRGPCRGEQRCRWEEAVVQMGPIIQAL